MLAAGRELGAQLQTAQKVLHPLLAGVILTSVMFALLFIIVGVDVVLGEPTQDQDHRVDGQTSVQPWYPAYMYYFGIALAIVLVCISSASFDAATVSLLTQSSLCRSYPRLVSSAGRSGSPLRYKISIPLSIASSLSKLQSFSNQSSPRFLWYT